MIPTEDPFLPVGVVAILRPAAVSVLRALGVDLARQATEQFTDVCFAHGHWPDDVYAMVAAAEGRRTTAGFDHEMLELFHAALGRPVPKITPPDPTRRPGRRQQISGVYARPAGFDASDAQPMPFDDDPANDWTFGGPATVLDASGEPHAAAAPRSEPPPARLGRSLPPPVPALTRSA